MHVKYLKCLSFTTGSSKYLAPNQVEQSQSWAAAGDFTVFFHGKKALNSQNFRVPFARAIIECKTALNSSFMVFGVI